MIRRHGVSVAVLLIAASAAIAATHTGEAEIEPTLRTEQTWFHCANDNKLQNLEAAQGNYPSWDITAPAASFTTGEGCGFYDNLLSGTVGGHPFASAIWTGSFRGNLDSITVELHRLLAGAGGSVTFPALVVTLTVDGAVLYEGDVTGLAWTPSSSGGSESTVWSFTGLGYLVEDGDGTIERTVTLRIDSYNEAQTAWVFDASEVPAGLIFNPESPAFVVVPV